MSWQELCLSGGDDRCSFTIRVDGTIGPTTVTEFEKVLARARGRSQLVITLNSPGGYVASALEIGRLIRNEQGHTAVEEDATCASACVLIFAAGLSRAADTPETAVDFPAPGFVPIHHKSAAIGIHRPALADISRETEMLEVKAAADQDEHELRQYAAEMNVNPQLIDDMFAIPPNEIKWLSKKDLQRYGLGFLDPVYLETVSINEAKKYNITPAEWRSRNSSALRACALVLSSDDTYGFLEGRDRSECVMDIIAGRVAAPPCLIEAPYVPLPPPPPGITNVESICRNGRAG
ncbi:MAG: hypothetical protein ACREDL_03790 [Bradyrhizobium sp.]